MEESLTIPKNLSQYAAKAMMIGMATASPLHADHSSLASPQSSGANISYVYKFATQEGDLLADELYTQALQKLTGVSSEDEQVSENATDNQTQLELVRQVFSPTGQQLADALGVSRTTIYNWLDGKTEVRPKNQNRLDALAQLANTWNAEKLSPTSTLRATETRQLFQLLASHEADTFDKAEALLKQWGGKPTRPRPKSIRQLQREQGMKSLPKQVSAQITSDRVRSIANENPHEN